MKRKYFIAGMLFVIAAPVGVYGWLDGWFSPGPSALVKDTFAKANAGRYEDAAQNLHRGTRQSLLDDPAWMKKYWDTVTKDRTIRNVQIVDENRGPNGEFGHIRFAITYADGSTIEAKEVISFMDGRWRHGVENLYDTIRYKQEKAKFESLNSSLSLQYSKMPLARVWLRLPEGCVWNPDERSFDQKESMIRIQADEADLLGLLYKGDNDRAFDSLIKRAEHAYGGTDTTHLQRKESLEKNVRTVAFDGIRTKENGAEWRIICVVIGKGDRAVILTGVVPNYQNLNRIVNESLQSVRWEKPE